MVEEPGFEPETADPKARAFPIKLLPRVASLSGCVERLTIGFGEQRLKLLKELFGFVVPRLADSIRAPDVIQIQRRHHQPRLIAGQVELLRLKTLFQLPDERVVSIRQPPLTNQGDAETLRVAPMTNSRRRLKRPNNLFELLAAGARMEHRAS